MVYSAVLLCSLVLTAAALTLAKPSVGANDIAPSGDKPSAALTAAKNEDTPVKKDEGPAAVKAEPPAAKEAPAAKEDTEKAWRPVNEKYPHAVLFGGTCGGTVISPKWILTAGHCTLFTSGRYVVAGTNNTEDGSGVTRRVKRLVIHPLFSVGPYWLDADEFNLKQVAARWDFLLAELAEPLPVDDKTIVAATLDDQPELPAGLNVAYAGYGTDHHGGTMRHEMHGMELSVQTDEVCSTLVEYNKQDMLCAKGRPPRYDSACNGDSGSGLVDESGRLVGIASWVQDDAHECKAGKLVYFSRVSAAREWIRQVTKL